MTTPNPWLAPIPERGLRIIASRLAKSSKELLDKLPSDEPIGTQLETLAWDGFRIEKLDGTFRKVLVVVRTTPLPACVPKEVVVIGGWSPKAPKMPGFDSAILMHIDADSTPKALLEPSDWANLSKLEYALFRRLAHEAQHAAELLDEHNPKRYDPCDPVQARKYVNQPREVRAYARQVALEAKEAMRGSDLTISEAVASSLTWQIIEHMLSDKSHKKLLSYVVNELD
jgi:hypothetical protein